MLSELVGVCVCCAGSLDGEGQDGRTGNSPRREFLWACPVLSRGLCSHLGNAQAAPLAPPHRRCHRLCTRYARHGRSSAGAPAIAPQALSVLAAGRVVTGPQWSSREVVGRHTSLVLGPVVPGAGYPKVLVCLQRPRNSLSTCAPPRCCSKVHREAVAVWAVALAETEAGIVGLDIAADQSLAPPPQHFPW